MIDEQIKDKQKVNGKTIPLPLQDVEKEMQPRLVESASVDKVDYASLLMSARVQPTDPIDEEMACLLIESNGVNYTIGTMGNISTVAGRAKSKKTFVISFAVAAAVASTLVLNRIKGQLPPNKQTVLVFDTEQTRYHVLRVVKRICRLSGMDSPPNLIVYSLRCFDPKTRLKAVDFALNNTPNIGLVIIDGIRDLAVDPILDADQASEIMTHLLQWTDRLNIHILNVLHMNKGDNNLRGHLGTELVNKSETVISVTKDSKDKEISRVEAEYCRNRDFEPFSFSIDENGLPQLVEEGEGDSEMTTRLGKQGLRKSDLPTADNMSAETVNAIIRRAFIQQPQLAYGQLKTNIIEASQHIGESLSEVRARSFIQRMVVDGKLIIFRPDKARWDFYQINLDTAL